VRAKRGSRAFRLFVHVQRDFGGLGAATVGLYKLNAVYPFVKAPGCNPGAFKVKKQFQRLLPNPTCTTFASKVCFQIQLVTLHRGATAAAAPPRAGPAGAAVAPEAALSHAASTRRDADAAGDGDAHGCCGQPAVRRGGRGSRRSMAGLQPHVCLQLTQSLEAAWIQPLNLCSKETVAKCAFQIQLVPLLQPLYSKGQRQRGLRRRE
jgi:hypothetical protein